MTQKLFSDKQMEYILNSTKKWNILHGPVRSGKTICGIYRFLQEAAKCPDSAIYIVGHTFDTAYRNIIRIILDNPVFKLFRPFCTWSGKKLYYRDKQIIVLGAKDEGALGNFQGDTYSLVYCNEMTLYPESIIDMIDTRLSMPHSIGFCDMNPTYPSHKLKEWIDAAAKNDPDYYACQIMLDDNPYLEQSYKDRIKKSLSGVFYKRNYLGMWCMAEGAIFDFFDQALHCISRPPKGADYFIAGIDYGTRNAFACILIGVSLGHHDQTGVQMWVQDEYYWNSDPKRGTGRQKTNSEYADDMLRFLEPYAPKAIYIDPSAASFKLELQRRGLHPVDANNDVFNGIQIMTNDVRNGRCLILSHCKNLIREMEIYAWDEKRAEKGEDKPIKANDHLIDALRYCLATHKVPKLYNENYNPQDYMNSRFSPSPRRY